MTAKTTSKEGRTHSNDSWVYSINSTQSFTLPKSWMIQVSVNYLSLRASAQGQDSRFLTPHLSLKKLLLISDGVSRRNGSILMLVLMRATGSVSLHLVLIFTPPQIIFTKPTRCSFPYHLT